MTVSADMKNKKKRPAVRAVLCAADVLWLGFIFSQSMRTAPESSVYSSRLTLFLQWLLQTEQSVAELEIVVRKAAHFTEFFLLGALAAATVAVFVLPEKPLLCFHWNVHAALAGLLPALCDETIQLFYEGRSAQVSDVWLDWSGYLCGLAVCLFCVKTVVKSVEKRYDNK